MPPPTGVVSGPLMATLYVRTASSVSFGSHSPCCSLAFSPAGTSNQAICFLPPNAFSTAASKTRTLARQMSGPVPSPSMNGMIGSSGTTSRPFLRVIAVPLVGGFRIVNVGIADSGLGHITVAALRPIFTETVEKLVEIGRRCAHRPASIRSFERFAPRWCAH